MTYPHDIEEKLGFDKVRQLLREKCVSVTGAERVDGMQFTTESKPIKNWLNQTWEFCQIIQSGESFPSSHFHDVRNALKKSKTPGAFLETSEMLDIRQSLETILTMLDFFEKHDEAYPYLNELTRDVALDSTLPDEILRVIDDDARVRDSASGALSSIRQSLRQRQQQLRKSIDSIFRQASKNGFIPDGASITVRDGRMVIPVLAEFKRRIKGFIHDESATGQTVYLEPAEVLEGNNALKELQYAESREVVKLLMKLTDQIRSELPQLHNCYHWMGTIDFIRAKARLANDLEAGLALMTDKAATSLINARHPLLHLNYKKAKKQVVPLTLNIDSNQRLIVISGPNAGGKSVCLKTVGLLQYMWQCGLLIPVSEESVVGIYKKMFVDIGDEQSIENDLSTYSSHLTFMRYFLEEANGDSLILIDEFGTGTDPLFGGAIAESMLAEFNAHLTRGIVTTHYSNIKKYAERTDGIENGAMKYDVQALEPLYILQLGKPGSSFSFEVARKIGLPASIIDQARQLLGSEQIDAEELIVRLEKREQRILSLEKEMQKNEKEAARLRQKYQDLFDRLESDKKEIIKKAKEEASSLLNRTNREIEKTIRHIKENKAEKKETKKMRGRLDELKRKVTPVKEKDAVRDVGEDIKQLAPGDSVRIVGQDVTGEVLSIRGKDAEIKIGGLKTLLKVNRLQRISRGEKKKQEKSSGYSIGSNNIDLNSKLANFKSTLDIRGFRGEIAMHEAEKFIDDALLFGVAEVRILHGKGDGILRKLVREKLKSHPQVKSFEDEHVERGGAGITVVTIK